MYIHICIYTYTAPARIGTPLIVSHSLRSLINTMVCSRCVCGRVHPTSPPHQTFNPGVCVSVCVCVCVHMHLSIRTLIKYTPLLFIKQRTATNPEVLQEQLNYSSLVLSGCVITTANW